MDKKDIGMIILVLALIALAGFTYYLYSGVTECKAIATDLGAQLIECGAGIDQYKAGLEECMTQATQCQEALISLQEVCAAYLPAVPTE